MIGDREEELQQLRSRATELALREDWNEYINLYTNFISVCNHHLLSKTNQDPLYSTKILKNLCFALTNRADARSRLRDFSNAFMDYDFVLDIDPSHLKALISKGKILLDLDRYSQASECFRRALDSQSIGNPETLRGLLSRSRRLETQSRTGALDLSEWIVNGFNGIPPELAEFLGPVEIRRSAIGGRGLFATKSIEAGTVLVVTKAVAIGRGILPEMDNGFGQRARMVMWKDFVERILDLTAKCTKTLYLMYTLSTGIEEGDLEIPDISLFRPETREESFILKNKEPDACRIYKILDVNCLTEDSIYSKVLGKNSSYSGVGLWILPSFINHSCNPNARRLHIGDHMVIHTSRDVKAGEEITFAYFDVLLPVSKRREAAKGWGFHCRCARCLFEQTEACFGPEIRELERMVLQSGLDKGEIAATLEDGIKRRWMLKGKAKGFLRASFWAAYSGVYESIKSARRWERKIPMAIEIAESITGAVGGDERVLKVVVGGFNRGGSGGGGMMEMEKAMKIARGVYGKVMKRYAMKGLFELLVPECRNH